MQSNKRLDSEIHEEGDPRHLPLERAGGLHLECGGDLSLRAQLILVLLSAQVISDLES